MFNEFIELALEELFRFVVRSRGEMYGTPPTLGLSIQTHTNIEEAYKLENDVDLSCRVSSSPFLPGSQRNACQWYSTLFNNRFRRIHTFQKRQQLHSSLYIQSQSDLCLFTAFLLLPWVVYSIPLISGWTSTGILSWVTGKGLYCIHQSTYCLFIEALLPCFFCPDLKLIEALLHVATCSECVFCSFSPMIFIFYFPPSLPI